jgi:hypothetical protein
MRARARFNVSNAQGRGVVVDTALAVVVAVVVVGTWLEDVVAVVTAARLEAP